MPIKLERSSVPTWYATDSLRHTRDLSAHLDDTGTLTVNSETTATAAVQSYFADPTGTAPMYRQLIASPSVQTGLSDDSRHWQHVVGSFCAAAGTPQDAVQSLLRARGAGQLTVYVNPARRTFKTQTDFLLEINAADRVGSSPVGEVLEKLDDRDGSQTPGRERGLAALREQLGEVLVAV